VFDQAALCALATVIREGSFERAAQALCVTPSAVSQRIRALEERVGCAPMVRRLPCQATDTGRRSCQHVDRGRWLEQELRGTLPSLALDGAVRVTLPIAVKADGLATWFTPAVAAIAADASVLVELTVDDQDHTAEWLRRGVVLAAVTDTARPPAGFDSRPLGVMRYRAARYFSRGVVAAGLELASSLVFNAKDDLQARWVRRPFQRDVPLPRHTWPSAHAFLAAALASMG
jgi:LysR family transcriptional regulator (chromosome initiation inhibitor)